MACVYCFGETPLEEAYAKQAVEALTSAYPNHSWWVECRGGVLIIKHFAVSGTIGMVRHLKSLHASHAILKSEIVRAAGELMERAGLPRRDYRGERVSTLEAPKHLVKHFHSRDNG
jgi:hypothetical protein